MEQRVLSMLSRCEHVCVFSILIPPCQTCFSFLCSEWLLLSLVWTQTDSSPGEHSFLSNEILTLCYSKQYLQALMVLRIIWLPLQHYRDNSDRVRQTHLSSLRGKQSPQCGLVALRTCLRSQCHGLSPLHLLPSPVLRKTARGINSLGNKQLTFKKRPFKCPRIRSDIFITTG